MQTYAAIDIGSNSCRLKIARVQQHQLKLLHEDREVTRLGASVFETGVISPETMGGTLVALEAIVLALAAADRERAVATLERLNRLRIGVGSWWLRIGVWR